MINTQNSRSGINEEIELNFKDWSLQTDTAFTDYFYHCLTETLGICLSFFPFVGAGRDVVTGVRVSHLLYSPLLTIPCPLSGLLVTESKQN